MWFDALTPDIAVCYRGIDIIVALCPEQLCYHVVNFSFSLR